ncbi:hypothetical protein QJS66_18335 [Kocuria rhizophila]|nr:hypothetical protein QJS66_18335 [Kocuria rhizophila]
MEFRPDLYRGAVALVLTPTPRGSGTSESQTSRCRPSFDSSTCVTGSLRTPAAGRAMRRSPRCPEDVVAERATLTWEPQRLGQAVDPAAASGVTRAPPTPEPRAGGGGGVRSLGLGVSRSSRTAM